MTLDSGVSTAERPQGFLAQTTFVFTDQGVMTLLHHVGSSQVWARVATDFRTALADALLLQGITPIAAERIRGFPLGRDQPIVGGCETLFCRKAVLASFTSCGPAIVAN